MSPVFHRELKHVIKLNQAVSTTFQVIESERPNGILLSFGGQTALNCGVKLQEQGVLTKYQLKILGTPVNSIISTEDRQIFSQKLSEINLKAAPSEAAYTIDQVRKSQKDKSVLVFDLGVINEFQEM